MRLRWQVTKPTGAAFTGGPFNPNPEPDTMNLKNKPNEYAEALGRTLDEAPKAVIAAVAVSLLSTGGDRLSQAESLFRLEWWVLFRAGIVPQRPPGPELTSENFVLPAPR